MFYSDTTAIVHTKDTTDQNVCMTLQLETLWVYNANMIHI